MVKCWLAAAAAALVLSPEAQAAPAEPTGQWVVNFDEAQCIASRRYGEDTLVIKAPPLGEVVQMALFTKGGVGKPQQAEGSIRLDGGMPIRLSALVFDTTKGRELIHTVNVTVADFAKVRAAKRLQWRFMGANRDLTLKGMEPMAKVMDECVANLRKVWNVPANLGFDGVAESPEPRPTGGNRAEENLARFFRSEDYPDVAIRGDQDGVVAFALLVNEQGRVADCTVVKTSGVASLDAQSCIILRQRARFEPARDATGTSVKDAKTGRIRWRLP
jgi:TonB family protein